jgi:hypothetical protein
MLQKSDFKGISTLSRACLFYIAILSMKAMYRLFYCSLPPPYEKGKWDGKYLECESKILRSSRK